VGFEADSVVHSALYVQILKMYSDDTQSVKVLRIRAACVATGTLLKSRLRALCYFVSSWDAPTNIRTEDARPPLAQSVIRKPPTKTGVSYAMMINLHFRIAFFASTLATSSLLALQPQQDATITVNASQILAPVNRLVFGQNIEAADGAYIFSSNATDLNGINRGEGFWDPATAAPISEVVDQSKAVGTSTLRYPGGCLAHNFDWRKTVGPDAKARGWQFGLDEYLSLCRAMNAMPLITISDYVLPADQMPENAAEMVEYLNSPADAGHPWAMRRKAWGHPAPYHVIWFELGNESMHGNHRLLPHRQFTAEQYAEYATATAAAMRKVDPDIKLGIIMVPGPGNDVESDWNRTVVHQAGAIANFAVIHVYAPAPPKAGISENVAIQSMMVAPQHVEERLANYHKMIQQQLGHDLPLAITEFNGGLDAFGSPRRFSYANALECADLLRVFLKPESNVALANYWQFVNGYFGMLRTASSPNGEPFTQEPVFFLYKLWAEHFGSNLLKVEVQSPRADFPGAGSEQAARGDVAEPRRQIQTFDLDQYSSYFGTTWPKLLNVQIQLQKSDLTVRLQNLNRSIYPTLARIPRPDIGPGGQVEFSLSFDAKFTPAPGSATAPVGIGLMDSRGWNQTHSGIGIDAITTDWKHFEATYRPDPQTTNVDVSARLIEEGKNVSGTLQVHNLAVTGFASPHDAAYPLLTSSASVSSDGKTIYLIVINKSASDSIPATIHLTGFSAAQARYWEVNGIGLESTTGVAETVQGAVFPLSATATSTHVFPAHSMTAIEISR
jgi:alpha-N-arabinofuranosidase